MWILPETMGQTATGFWAPGLFLGLPGFQGTPLIQCCVHASTGHGGSLNLNPLNPLEPLDIFNTVNPKDIFNTVMYGTYPPI